MTYVDTDYRLKFEQSSDSDFEMEPLFYNNDPQLPIFSVVSNGYQATEVARILMDPKIDSSKVCRVQPRGVTKNATFIIDVDHVNFDDLKADDLGSWITKGTKPTFFRLLANGSICLATGKPELQEGSDYYLLTRRYYTHATYGLFRRIIVDIKGLHVHISLICS